MKNEQKARIAQIWAMLAAYYRTKLDDAVLMMYAEDVSDLDFESVQSALSGYRKNPKNKFMPMPAQIREMIQPLSVDPDSASREIAARITAAIPKFGWCNGQEAREYIGEVGWSVVQRQGGWAYVCEHHGMNIDPTSFQAQVRELAKSTLTHSPEMMAQAIGLQSATPRPELQAVKEILELTGKTLEGA
jgi:hypothetical protein